MLDIMAIQQMAHSLIKNLSGFDSQRIVAEKQEDGAAIRVAGEAIASLGNAIEMTAEDALISEAEVAEIKARLSDAADALKAAGAEVIDQEDGPEV